MREVPRRPLLGRAHRDPRELRGGGRPHAILRRQEEELDLLPAVHANLQSGPPRGPTFCPHPQAHRKQKPRKRIGCNQSGNKAAHHGALGKNATCSHNQHRNLAGRKRKHTLQEARAPIARKCPRGNAGYAWQRQRQCGNNTR